MNDEQVYKERALDVVVLSPHAVTPTDVQMVRHVAGVMIDSRKIGKQLRLDELIARMYIAVEHGFPATSALSVVYLIDKQPSLAPKAIWAKVLNHPDFEGMEEIELLTDDGDFNGYKIGLKRKKMPMVYRQFTLNEAREISINAQGDKMISKSAYKNYPKPMCQWRALGFVIDMVFPDVSLGLLRAPDLGASVDENWDVIEGSWGDAPVTAIGVSPYEFAYLGLIDRWELSDILRVNNNKKPQSVGEVDAITNALEAENCDEKK